MTSTTQISTPHAPRPTDRLDRSAAARGAIARFTRASANAAARHPKTFIALWLLMVVACTFAGSAVGTKSLTNVQSEVGDSAKADAMIAQAGLADPAVESILVTSPSASVTSQTAAALTRALTSTPAVSSVRGPNQSSALSTNGGRTVLVQASLKGDPGNAPDHVAPIQTAVAAVARTHPNATLSEAGDGTEGKQINDVISNDLSRAEKLSLPITLVILVIAFGALVAASVPLLLGLTSVAAALGALGLVSHLAPNSDSTSAVVVLIGLAVGVDYSLFYVRREREERSKGLPEARLRRKQRTKGSPTAVPGSALEAAAASVGRAIVVSGLTVIVALAGLLITGQGDFISMGLGTILVVLFAVIGSVTVLPAVLALLGDKVDRGRFPGYRGRAARRARRDAAAGQRRGVWAGLARSTTRHPKAALITAVCTLGALAVPLFGMHTSDLSLGDLPPTLPIVQAAQSIEASFPGSPSPVEFVVQGTDLNSPNAVAGLQALGHRALIETGGKGDVTVAVSHDARIARIDIPMPDHGSAASAAAVKTLRADVAPSATAIPGVSTSALVTGAAASGLDYTNRMGSATPEVIAFVLALGFLLLLLTFRAPVLAGAVMLLNLLSIGAAYGILTAVFQHTWAEHLLSFHSTGHIINWMPLFMFVVLFGLSMDYTILVLERIREARVSGMSPRAAAAEGVGATGGTITSAAVVMVAVFAIFASLDVITFKQLGVGLAAAVLLDATLVRGVALPAAVALLGERGWPMRRSLALQRS